LFFCSFACFCPLIFLCLFVCFVIVGYLFLFLFLLSFFLSISYQLYHHHLLILTLTPFSLPPSPVLKSIALLPNKSFCSFSTTLSPYTHPPPPILPQLVTRLILTPTHSSPAGQSTMPTLHNPTPLQSLTQASSTITTEIYPNTDKNQKPLQCFPHSPTPFPASTFSATLLNSPNFHS
jgi:hypothetical protein